MTEDEAKLILGVRISRFDHADDVNKALDVAKSALEEIRQYRAIGTVEDITKVVRFLSVDNDESIIDDIEEVTKYRLIGTIEECREAIEKQKAKKPNKRPDKYTDLVQHYSCPVCGKYFGQAGVHNEILFRKSKYCTCGQSIDWSDSK